jgi:hypothetical protein
MATPDPGSHTTSSPPGGIPREAAPGLRPIRRALAFPVCAAVLLILAIGDRPVRCQESGDPASTQPASGAASASSSAHRDLAKKLQNPFADLIVVPLQNITYLGVGPGDGSANTLNLQPVFPISISKNWNLLMRPVLPISYTSVPESEFGLGDLSLEPFLSPSKARSITWGVGPILGIPTGTDHLLGTGKWTVGPSFALFAQRGHWAASLILNQQWSYAGDPARDPVSLLQIQPTVSYILEHGWFLTSGPLISANWTAPSGQQWIVPLGAGVGRVFSARGQKMNLQLEGYGTPVRPDDGPKTLIILTLSFLFPR